MLSDQQLTEIAKLIKADPAAFVAAAKSAEVVAVTLPEGLAVFTPAELTARDTNTKESVKAGHHAAGYETAIKDIKAKAGLTFEGKDVDKLVTEFKASLNLKPDERVKELEKQISVLQQTAQSHEANAGTFKTQAAQAMQRMELLKAFPQDRDSKLTTTDYLTLLESRVEAKEVDGKTVYVNRSTGAEYRDTKTGAALATEAVVDDIFTQSGWKAAPGSTKKEGRNGSSSEPAKSGSGTPTKYSEAAAAWVADGKSLNSADFPTYLNKLQTENTAFEMDLA